MINGLFKEISEEEMMSVNGGCGGGSPSPGNSKATPECHTCQIAKDLITATSSQMYDPHETTTTSQVADIVAAVVNLAAHAHLDHCNKNK